MLSQTKLPLQPGVLVYDDTDIGRFFLYNPTTTTVIGSAFQCRDQFFLYSWTSTDHLHVGYKSPKVNLERTAAFLEMIEARLGLPERSVVHPVADPTTMIVKIPAFWAANDTRRSFFTLFLRTSVLYYETGMTTDDAFKVYFLAAPILTAINYFLDGHTVPTYGAICRCDQHGFQGVCAMFQGLDADLDKMLVKPDIEFQKYVPQIKTVHVHVPVATSAAPVAPNPQPVLSAAAQAVGESLFASSVMAAAR